jgi:guanylate kinase
MTREMISVPGLPEIIRADSSGILHKVVGREFQLNESEQPIIVISGTSGAGKDTIVERLPAERYTRVRTCTTRIEIRDDEMVNDPYNRLKMEEFELQIEEGRFVEYAKYGSNYYGTREEDIRAITTRNMHPVLRIDPQGVRSYATGEVTIAGHQPLCFFVLPPTLEDMWLRLYNRDVERHSDQTKRDAGLKRVGERMQLAKQDIELSKHAHYLLVNPDNQVEKAIEALIRQVDSLFTHPGNVPD